MKRHKNETVKGGDGLAILEQEIIKQEQAPDPVREETSLENDVDIESENKSSDSAIMNFFLALFETVYISFFNYMRIVGVYTIKIANKVTKKIIKFYDKHLSYYVYKLRLSFLKIIKFFQKGLRFFFYKIFLFLKFFVDAFIVVRKGYLKKSKKGFLAGIGGAIVAFFKGVKNNKPLFITWRNYALPVIAIALFGTLIQYVTTLNFAVSVEYNGEHIGYIENETVFEQAEAKLQQRMTYLVDDEVIDNIPQFTLAVVPQAEIKSDLELTDAIIQSSNQDIVQATGLSIDGVFYGAVKDGALIENKLEEKLNKYKTTNKNEAVKYTKDVSLEPGLFVAKNITSSEELVKLIDLQEDKDVYDVVKENDTPIIVAARNDISLDELVKLNPGILEDCKIGRQVTVNKSQPFLPVSVVREETYEEEIAFQTEYTDSSKYYKGTSSETRAGVNGKQKVTASIEYVDGIEVKRTILNTDILSQPVSRKVTRGTGVFYADNTPYNGSTSSSGFIWPVSGSYISSGYGYRGRSFHTGIDCAFRGNGYGSPIRAAAAGKVIYARWGGSYGNLVKIDHGGGVQTWYAHSSKLLVKEGQIVSQGQQIARVGSTGRSTGNHLHFEVRVNGSTKSPLNYLP